MDGGAWWAEVYGVAKSQTRLSDFTFTFHFSLFTFMHWRRKWQPTPVLLPGKSHGQRSLVGYSLWGREESDTTERLHFHFASLVAQMVKNLPTMWETQVQSLGQEDSLEKGMATHSTMLAWRIL